MMPTVPFLLQAFFPSSVKWMLLEFSSESQTGQPEDFLQLYLTLGANGEVRSVIYIPVSFSFFVLLQKATLCVCKNR